MRKGEEARMLSELLDVQDELSNWEVSFVESIGDTLDRSGKLTPKQLDKLVDIYEKRVLRY